MISLDRQNLNSEKPAWERAITLLDKYKMEKETPRRKRLAIQKRIKEMAAVKSKLSQAHGRRIPRSLLGREGGVELAKIVLEDSNAKRKTEEGEKTSVGINGHKFKLAFTWTEIMERCHARIDEDLEPYFKRFRKVARRNGRKW